MFYKWIQRKVAKIIHEICSVVEEDGIWTFDSMIDENSTFVFIWKESMNTNLTMIHTMVEDFHRDGDRIDRCWWSAMTVH